MDDLAALNLPKHGGDITWASHQFGIPRDQWLDLSTGISPWSWHSPVVPQEVFRRLPPDDLPLREIAATYYSCESNQLLPVPGSQFLISKIPFSVERGCVALPKIGYKEHEYAWKKAGHRIVFFDDQHDLLRLLANSSPNYVVIINPNNPGAEEFQPKIIKAIQGVLAETFPAKHMLVLDEAFCDSFPQLSLSYYELGANTIVLRSVGKFFGLAGVRMGFLLAHEPWLSEYRAAVSPWLISHPAVWMSSLALADVKWIESQKNRIKEQSARMLSLLREHYHPSSTIRSSDLFHTVFASAPDLYRDFIAFAQEGILLRYQTYDRDSAWLRFGLPGEAIDVFIEKSSAVFAQKREELSQ